MEKGQLMNADAVYELLMEYLLPGGEGHETYLRASVVILDGIIKARSDVDAFERVLLKYNTKLPLSLQKVMNIVAPESELVARNQTRVALAKEANIAPRPDDDAEIYRHRLEEYVRQTNQVIRYYETKLPVIEIDSTQGLEHTTIDLMDAIQSDRSMAQVPALSFTKTIVSRENY